MNELSLLSVAVDGASVTLLVLLGIRLVSQSPNYRIAVLFAVVILGVISYVVSARHDYGALIDPGFRLDLGQLHPMFNLMRNPTSGAFMLLCHLIFRDTQRVPPVFLALWFVQLFLEEPLGWLVGGSWTPEVSTLVFEAIPSVLQIVLVAFALYWMLANSEADLIQSRRRARVLLAIVYGLQVALSVLIERVAFGFGWIHWEWQYPIHVALIALGLPCTSLMLFATFSPNTPLVLGAARRVATVDETSELLARDEMDTRRIRHALEKEAVYRTPGLTVLDLARHLSLPEYRLRNLIHTHLGYRNFNALLHRYRVEEVCRALADPEQNSTPVLTLALSAGYQSINPFNRAFRELKGVTPTVFRRQSQQEVTHE